MVEVVEFPILAKLAKPVLEVVAVVLAAVVAEKGVVINAAKGETLLLGSDDGTLVSDLNALNGSKAVLLPSAPLAPPT